ncbi:MAG: hypothetical protein JRS35_26610, partial [Deltaproteobacteria bacterium]|nr:hypothetical protein [Deltaproteobacteria bacterium]
QRNGTLPHFAEIRLRALRRLLTTVASDVLGLLPICGARAPARRPCGASPHPSWGGVVTATLVTLLVLPVLFVLWHEQGLAPASKAGGNAER